jgi:membrane-bound lytic murein transglycosylase D
MVAAARIAKEPEKYGFGDVEMEAPLAYEEVVVDPATPLEAIAAAAGATLDEIRDLNPHFKLERTRNDRRQLVRVPSGTRTSFLVNWPTVRDRETLALTTYRVRAGDSLLAIAGTARGFGPGDPASEPPERHDDPSRTDPRDPGRLMM